MDCKEPSSMEELIYFTNRNIGKGNAKAWAYKIECPNCKKELMSKPIDPKTKKYKIRASYYECPACHHQMDKKDVDPQLEVEVIYTCPSCANHSCVKLPYKRKKFEGVDAFVFACDKCGETIGITKKMKKPKKKTAAKAK